MRFRLPAVPSRRRLGATGVAAVALAAAFFIPTDATASGIRTTIRASQIQFDHAGSQALPLRVNYSTSIVKPEWVAGTRNQPCLFVQETPVTVLVRFEAPLWLTQAYFWAESDGPLGGLPGQTVHFTNGVSDPEYYEFTAERPTPSGIGMHEWSWQWMVASTAAEVTTAVRPLNVSGKHRLYTILANPGKPWRVDLVSTQNPWTEALDVAMGVTHATTPEGVLDDMVRFVHDRPCFQYDIVWGSPCYVSGLPWKLNLTLVLADIRLNRPPRTGCCYDGALIVHTLADVLGASTRYLLSGQPYTSRVFGYLNVVDPIGRGVDYANNPFHNNVQVRKDAITFQDGTSGSCGRSAFSNHGFAGTVPGAGAVIWDATMLGNWTSNPDTLVQFPPDGSWVSTGLTATVLTDTNAEWVPGQWVGMLLNPNTNRTYPNPYVEYTIVANTATTITVADGSNLVQYAVVGDHYWVRDPANPRVRPFHLTGYPWTTYEQITVDRVGPYGADAPVEGGATIY